MSGWMRTLPESQETEQTKEFIFTKRCNALPVLLVSGLVGSNPSQS
jgi:hypothetical protein